MLEKYLQMFANLRTDKGRDRYPAITYHRAPHKPFLLLSIMDLVAQGRITENLIEPSFELVDTFNTYWGIIMPPGSTTSMAYPFSRLKTDRFWHRVPKPGYDPDVEYNVKSMARLREMYLGAKIDEELFKYLCNTETRERLRAVLINTYFVPEVRPLLEKLGRVNYDAYKYSQTLLKIAEPEPQYGEGQEEEDFQQAVRDQGFRKAIVSLYEHRCALCGIRMLTPEGHTVVEAAHIKPWSEDHDDRPTNGLALCRLCHWSFDEGLMSVGLKYEVLVSRRVQIEQNLPGHILTLRDRHIFTPGENQYWPAQENFDYHRKNAFLK
jgi:putative restriction endonuclease